MRSSVLMSLRPRYADAILTGEKTVELRRRRPSFPPGTSILIYASSPDQRVLGTFIAGEVLEAPPDVLWPTIRDRAGVSRDEFDSYFTDCHLAYAIEVSDPRRLSPAQLGIRPPQSYLFLRRSHRQHRRLLRLLPDTA
jgi:predicted transcriptional regulator